MTRFFNKILRYFEKEVLDSIKRNKKEFIVLIVILAVGAFLRLYKIDQYMTFLGDEGRDVVTVRRLLVEHHPPLIGPGTSIGNMYLGPLYYYLMAPMLLIANFSPVGPAIGIALLGVVTIYFVWLVGQEWFGKWAGLIASALYALSPVVIIYSRSSWNPNIMPFFALLCVYSIWRVYKYNESRWLIAASAGFAAALQSHYLGLLLFPTVAIFWVLTLLNIKRKIPHPGFLLKNFWRNSLVGTFVFLFLMSPLVIFDARHGWNNFSAMKKFFTERQATVSANPLKSIPNIFPVFSKSFGSLLGSKNMNVGYVGSTLLGIYLLSYLVVSKVKHKKIQPQYLILFTWIFFALIGLALYKQEIYDHYYGFFFPAPFLLLGALGEYMIQYNTVLRFCAVVLFVFLVTLNLNSNPLKYSPNMQLQRTQEVAGKIRDEAGGNKFNLAVIAERNYEGAYKYFLLLWGTKVTDIEPLDTNGTITGQLFVVCEMPKDKCDPTHNPKAEAANFGWSKVEQEWSVAGTTVFKLVHSL